jgi:hypothetical protein
LTKANLRKVFIGIESPDDQVLETSRKYHNLKNPLLESLNNLKNNGMAVMGSFIIGLDGETQGAGQRICAFMDQTDIPLAMLGVLQAAPSTSLWSRLEREGRLRGDEGHGGDVGDDGGTFSALNYEPDRPEAEIMQEYVDAWDYLYEPSRYLARAYRYYLAMPATRRSLRIAAEPAGPGGQFLESGMTLHSQLGELRAFSKILWTLGVRSSYRRQFWTQLIGMLRKNPSRFTDYVVTCAMGEDLYHLRKVVRDKVGAIVKELNREAPPAPFQGHSAIR